MAIKITTNTTTSPTTTVFDRAPNTICSGFIDVHGTWNNGYFILPRTNPTDTPSEPLVDIFTNSTSSDNDSLSTFMRSPSPILTKPEESLLIEIPALTSTNNNQEHQESPRSSQSMVFVDTVVTNIFSVAKQAGSTAKAIFNTLQANDETTQSHHHQQQQQQQQRTLVNTRNSSVDDFFEHVDYSETTNGNLSLSNDPMEILIEMGFVNREKNQRLLVENKNDLNKVIELLADDDNDDVD
ncbi:unnamed protein product [Rotaria sp. Silwood2]|nr:unnamed protein product [Rotaria sp. Silwood2]